MRRRIPPYDVELAGALEHELITLEAHVDQLLDRPLTQFDRVQADALERMATRLGRMASTLRMSLGRAPGTLGAAMEQQSKGFAAPNWMRPKGSR